MLFENIFMAALGIVMGALIVAYRHDYARWAFRQAPAIGNETTYRALFLAFGLSMNAGSLAVLVRQGL